MAVSIDRFVVVFDTPDLAKASAFWAGLLDGTVYPDDDWHSVMVDDVWRLGFQLAPNYVAPDWPEGMPQQQLHLDIHVDDLDVAHEKAIALGARVLKPAVDPDALEGFQVYADPVGHPFCLCWDHRDRA